MKDQANKIQEFLLGNVEKHPNRVVGITADRFGVSRTTVLRHINHLISANKLIKSGTTKQVVYSLVEGVYKELILPLNAQFDEYEIFSEHLQNDLATLLNKRSYKICEYGITEILNNAKDHSNGSKVIITSNVKNQSIEISVRDDGVGLFQKLNQALHASDIREVILELSKGKFTTDPVNHTGEGIFFSSRSFDEFCICASGYTYLRNNIENDWVLMKAEKLKGTRLTMKISLNTSRDLVEIFKLYQNDDTLDFSKTDIYVELSKLHGERLISRSQAKRILRHLEKFEHITLDFKGVESIGQGFVDEIFRVYQNQHPDVIFEWVNANDEVEFMIKRGIAAKSRT